MSMSTLPGDRGGMEIHGLDLEPHRREKGASASHSSEHDAARGRASTTSIPIGDVASLTFGRGRLEFVRNGTKIG